MIDAFDTDSGEQIPNLDVEPTSSSCSSCSCSNGDIDLASHADEDASGGAVSEKKGCWSTDISRESMVLQFQQLDLPFDDLLPLEALQTRAAQVQRWLSQPLPDLRSEAQKCEIEAKMPSPPLVSKCWEAPSHFFAGVSKRDATERCSIVEQLILHSWCDSWRSWDIPALKIGLSASGELMAKFAGWQALDRYGLLEECRKMSVPSCSVSSTRPSLIRTLRKVAMWQQLSVEALFEECLSCDVSLDDAAVSQLPEAERRTFIQNQLLNNLLYSEWEAQGIPAKALGSLDVAARVAEEHGAVERMSMADLWRWYGSLGLPRVRSLHRNNLVSLLQAMIVWKALPLAALRSRAGIAEEDLATSDNDEETVKQRCLDKLFTKMMMNIWDSHGFEAHRLGSFDVARELVMHQERLEGLSNDLLKKEYSKAGFTLGGSQERVDMLNTLRLALLWEMLPLEELEAELQKRGLDLPPPDGDDIISGGDSRQDARRTQLMQCLKTDLKVDKGRLTYEKRGIPVSKLGTLKASLVAATLDCMETASLAELQSACEDYGVPRVTSSSRVELLRILKDITIWIALPVSELMAEVEARSCVNPAASAVLSGLVKDEDEQRELLLDALMLWRFTATFAHEGLDAKRLSSFSSATHVLRTWLQLQGQSFEDLMRKYQEVGEWYLERVLPTEKDLLKHAEVLEVLKKTIFWQELPMPALQKEVAEGSQKVQLKLSSEGPEDELERRQLVGAMVAADRLSAWNQRGFEALRLGDFDTALQVVTQYEAFRAMDDSALADVYKQSGLPVVPHMTRDGRLRAVRDLLLWEALPEDELHQECVDKGVPVQGDRENIISWLVLSSLGHRWQCRGIPALRLRDLGAVESIIREVDRLQTLLNYAELVGAESTVFKDEYKKRGLPCDGSLNGQAHVGRLREILVWERLPLSELQQECKKSGAALPVNSRTSTEEAQRSDLIKLLVIATWRDSWEARGIAAQRIGNLALIEELMLQVDKLLRATKEQVLGDIQRRGLKVDSEATLPELRDHMKEVLHWEYMPLSELQQECREQNVPVARPTGLATTGAFTGMLGRSSIASAAQPAGLAARAKIQSEALKPANHLLAKKAGEGAEADPRSKMISGLMEQRRMQTWEKKGIPVMRLKDFKEAEKLVARHAEVDQLSKAAALKWYQDTGFPKEATVTPDEIKNLAKLVILWEALPVEELQRECEKRSLPVPASDKGVGAQCQLMKDRLLLDERMTMWHQSGVPARRIADPQKVMQVVANNEHYARLSLAELQSWYKELGLPMEKTMSREELESLARKLCIWQAFPLDELEQEYGNTIGESLEIEPSANKDERRQRLLDALLLNEKLEAWEHRGFQPKRLGNAEKALQAVVEYERYEAMTLEELRDACKQAGLPVEASSDTSTCSTFTVAAAEAKSEPAAVHKRPELLQAVKTVLLWELMPADELQKECLARSLSVPNNDRTQEVALQNLKIDLAVKMDSASFEREGIPLSELSSLQAAQVRAHFRSLAAASTAALSKMYSDSGLLRRLSGDSGDSDNERDQMLHCLKHLVLWQEFSVASLKKLCDERGLPSQSTRVIASAEERKDELIRRLSTDMVVTQQLDKYEALGIPVVRLTSLAVAEVAKRLAELNAKSGQELCDLHRIGNILGAPAVPEEELRARLHDAVLWEAFSAGELAAECRRQSISLDRLDGATQPEKAREVLLDCLLLHRCAESFRSMQIPVWRLQSFSTAVALSREWSLIDTMQDMGLRTRYSCYGVSPQALLTSELRERLRTLVLWAHLPSMEFRDECQAYGLNVPEQRGNRMDTIRRLAALHWPNKAKNEGNRAQGNKALAMLNRAQHFRVLQLPISAGLEDVKKAYRRLALKYHPDKNQGPQQEMAAQQFRKVAEAYEALTELLRST